MTAAGWLLTIAAEPGKHEAQGLEQLLPLSQRRLPHHGGSLLLDM